MGKNLTKLEIFRGCNNASSFLLLIEFHQTTYDLLHFHITKASGKGTRRKRVVAWGLNKLGCPISKSCYYNVAFWMLQL